MSSPNYPDVLRYRLRSTYLRATLSLQAVTRRPDLSRLRWVVDELVDFEVVAEVFARLVPLVPHFGMDDVLRLRDEEPALFARNASIDPSAGWRRPSTSRFGSSEDCPTS